MQDLNIPGFGNIKIAHIVTGDTRGTAAAELAGLDVEIAIIFT